MKRTISKLLGITALAIAGIGSSLMLATPAQAALQIDAIQLGIPGFEITCYARWGDAGNYPDDGTTVFNAHFIYCGKEIANLPTNPTQAQLQNLGLTSLNAIKSLPTTVKSQLASKFVSTIVFKDIRQNFGSQNKSVPADQVNFSGSSNYTVFPPRTWIYEQSIQIIPQAYEVAFNSKHEMGHHFQYYQPPLKLANNAIYKQLVARDFLYLDLKLPGNTYRGTYSYWLTNYAPPDSRLGYEEMFAEQIALAPNLPNSTPASVKPVDPILRDYFKCGQAFVNAQRQAGVNPVKSDFTALNTAADPDVYSRCVLPYKPLVAACSYVPDANLNYPWLKAETTFYVYCGSNPTRFSPRSDILTTLPTATPTQWRQKFQYAGYALYIFQDSAQALSLLGAAAVPTTATAVGVLGFHQPQPVGNATTPFIAMFERVKQANGTYLEHPGIPTVDLFNYDQAFYRETGRGIDRIAGTNGSASALFRNRITGDISRFNLKDGCAAGGPDSTLWGSLKSTICNTTTNVKKPPYVGVSNLAIVRGLSVAQIGSGALQFPPDYQAMFANVPTATNFSLIWAELIGFRRADIGNDFKGMHIWLTKVYPCGKLYTDAFYTTAAPIAATGACP